jgi:Glycine zipper 2TM domain
MKTNFAAILLAASVTGCVTSNTVNPAPSRPEPEPAPLARVYFYPQSGQTEAQQDRDRYECYSWAVRQTHFDPGRRGLPPEQRAAVVPARAPGVATAVGAVAGAVIGATVAARGDEAGGAIIGAVAGGVLGSASDAADAADAQRNRQREGRPGRATARYEQESAEYRRAMSACLEGRGYTVK